VLVAEVAPLGPAGGYTLITFGAVAALVVCWALKQTWQHTFHVVLHWLGKLGLSFSVLGHGVSLHPFGFALKLDRQVFNYLNDAVYACERAVVYGLTGMRHWALWMTNETIRISHALWQVATGIDHKVAHGAAGKAARAVSRVVVKRVSVVEHKVVHVTRVVGKVGKITLARVKALEASIAHELPRVRTLEREAKAEAARLRRIEKKLTAVGIVGLLGIALARMGLRWLRCSNVNRLGRAVCNAPVRWIDDLLGLLADYFILTNICVAIPWLESAFEQIAAPAIAELAAAGAGLCGAGYEGGPALDVPALHLPAAGYALHLPR
jgi:hypothetical protein